MALFRINFDRPGPGVEKDGPAKKGFARWWEIFIRDFFALLIGNTAFFVCALPMLASSAVFYFTSRAGYPWTPALLLNVLFAVLLGPALAALHHLTLQMCRDVPAFAWHEFKKAYKQNFKQGALAMVVFAVFGDILLFSMCMLPWMENIGYSYLLMLLLGSYIWFAMLNAVFQQIALIEKDLSGIFKNAFILMLAGGWRSVVVTLLDIAVLVLAFEYAELFLSITMFGFFGIMTMTTDLIFWPRFEKLFIKGGEEPPRRVQTARKEWQALVGENEKKAEKDRAEEEWAKNFLAERDELNDDADEVQPEEESLTHKDAET